MTTQRDEARAVGGVEEVVHGLDSPLGWKGA